MNVVHLLGTITRDVDIRYTQNSKVVGRFSVAVRRSTKSADGKYESDFISCIAFGKTAETIGNYFSKGSRILVTGKIQTGSYTDKSGQKKYTTDVVVDNFEFVDKKGSNSGGGVPFSDMGGAVSDEDIANMTF